MWEIEVQAKTDQLETVLDFLRGHLEEEECPMKTMIQLEVSVEEIFVNIAHYAYEGGEGTAVIELSILDEPKAAQITFRDRGVQFDPLAKPDPDVTESAEERRIGGLGIFMVKKSSDGLTYEYKNGENVLVMTKNFYKS